MIQGDCLNKESGAMVFSPNRNNFVTTLSNCLSFRMAIFFCDIYNTSLMSTEGNTNCEITVGFVFV